MPTNIPCRTAPRPPSRLASAIFLALPLFALAMAMFFNPLAASPPF
jgi:hypothetical protein